MGEIQVGSEEYEALKRRFRQRARQLGDVLCCLADPELFEIHAKLEAAELADTPVVPAPALAELTDDYDEVMAMIANANSLGTCEL